MGTKMVVAFANISWAKSKQKSLAKVHSNLSPGNDISTTFPPSGTPTKRNQLRSLLKQITTTLLIKFTAHIFDTDTIFLDTSVYIGERFTYKSVLDIRTHSKPTDETFQYTRFPSGHHQELRKDLRLLRTNSSKTALRKNRTLQITCYWERLP